MTIHSCMNRNSLYAVGPGKSNNIIYHDNMDKKQLEKLTKSQLIKMLMETKNRHNKRNRKTKST